MVVPLDVISCFAPLLSSCWQILQMTHRTFGYSLCCGSRRCQHPLFVNDSHHTTPNGIHILIQCNFTFPNTLHTCDPFESGRRNSPVDGSVGSVECLNRFGVCILFFFFLYVLYLILIMFAFTSIFDFEQCKTPSQWSATSRFQRNSCGISLSFSALDNDR